MKIKLLFAFLAFSLLSCSSDDGNEPVNTNPDDNNPPVEKQLNEISTLIDGELAELLQFENNKLKKRIVYRDGQVGLDSDYTYDSDGRLITEYIYTFSAEWNPISYLYEITYDNEGRINTVTMEYPEGGVENQVITDVFNYDVPNKVIATSTVTNNGEFINDRITTYYLNDAGLIYKLETIISEYDYTIEAEFDEFNNIVQQDYYTYDPGSGESASRSYSFTYDIETEVKGEYLNVFTTNRANYIGNNQFGSNKANTALYTENVSSPTNNYESTLLLNGVLKHKVYEFDDEGYPVKMERFEGEELEIEQYITYE